MKIDIFDVTHGFCAYLVADNGNVMLFDCGHNEKTGFRPSEYLPRKGCTGIEHLIIQNFDQDHVSDLPNLLDTLSVDVLYQNSSVSPEGLKAIKEENGPLTIAMSRAIKMKADYCHDVVSPPEFPDIEFKTFYNSYPSFTDTNNLSMLSFVHYNGVGVAFTGDLEKSGWDSLLGRSEVQSNLRRTDIFIASHHGRENGYNPRVFDYCSPDVVIISDKEIVHETQKQIYQKHASGVTWDGGPQRRYVLTTRSDGNIRLEKKIGDEGYHITTGV